MWSGATTGSDRVRWSARWRNTFHHLSNRVRYFATLRRSLRPGGRIAIIDFDGDDLVRRLGSHWVAPEQVVGEMQEAGFVLHQEVDLLRRQSFLIFAAPPFQ